MTATPARLSDSATGWQRALYASSGGRSAVLRRSRRAYGPEGCWEPLEARKRLLLESRRGGTWWTSRRDSSYPWLVW